MWLMISWCSMSSTVCSRDLLLRTIILDMVVLYTVEPPNNEHIRSGGNLSFVERLSLS